MCFIDELVQYRTVRQQLVRLPPPRDHLLGEVPPPRRRLGAVFEASDRAFAERVTEGDVAISRDDR